MIKAPDGTILRNLQEQVLKNKDDIKEIIIGNEILAKFGIKIVGEVELEENLPDPATYGGEYGDAYIVGVSAPFSYYIFTRPNASNPDAHWFNIGEFPLAGPQGPQGETGPQGPEGEGRWVTSSPANPVGVIDEHVIGIINSNTGDVFRRSTSGWNRIGNIRGPQGPTGPQGPQGETGPQGAAGPKGDTGDVGGFINIAGNLSSAELLPLPSTLHDLTKAYLVGENHELYIQVGETSETAVWQNMGVLNVATYVTVNGEFQNVWDADTKADKDSVVHLAGDETITGIKTFSSAISVNNIKDLSGTQRFTIGSTILVNATPVPSSNNTRDLGNENYKWKDLYLSSSIHLGNNLTISEDENGNTVFYNNYRNFRFRGSPVPYSNASISLGSNAYKWNDGHFAGKVYTGHDTEPLVNTSGNVWSSEATHDSPVEVLFDIATEGMHYTQRTTLLPYDTSIHQSFLPWGGRSATAYIDEAGCITVDLGAVSGVTVTAISAQVKPW